MTLPSSLATRYRLATTREVWSWSHGKLLTRRTGKTDWRGQNGTLDDQTIFGPLRDCECACSTYRGPSHQGMICHWCGVKVTSKAARRERFAHIELVPEIPHPLGGGAGLLAAFPVLPAAYVASPAGEPLAGLYEELVERTLAPILDRLVEIILPALQLAHEWTLPEAALLARGLALEQRDQPI